MVLVVPNLPANAGDTGDPSLIPGLGRSPGEGDGNPFQYSCPENPMDRGAWQDTVHGAAESDMTEQLSAHTENTTKEKKLCVLPSPIQPSSFLMNKSSLFYFGSFPSL